MSEPAIPCEVCGEPASVHIADLIEQEPVTGTDGDVYRKWKDADNHHHFCTEHERPARRIYRAEPLPELKFEIDHLTGIDLRNGFLETLASLAPVDLTVEQAIRVFQKAMFRGPEIFVARIGTRVIGTATLVQEQKFIHRGGRAARIEDVAVHKDFQGRGVGSAMVTHLVEVAKKSGCYKVVLNASEQVKTFYYEAGFRCHDVGMRIDL